MADGAEAVPVVEIQLDHLCIDPDSKAVLASRSLSEAEGRTLMKNIRKKFKDYFKTNVNSGSLMDYIFISKVYKMVYEKLKSQLEDSDGNLTKKKNSSMSVECQ